MKGVRVHCSAAFGHDGRSITTRLISKTRQIYAAAPDRQVVLSYRVRAVASSASKTGLMVLPK